MRILKIKLTKENRITVKYEKQSNVAGMPDEYFMTCADRPLESLLFALADLAPHVIDMCELPLEYEDRITVKSVSYSYGGEAEVMGATITATMHLEKSSCDLNLNTPHKASGSYSDAPAQDGALLTDECIKVLERLAAERKVEEERYVKGERQQTNLFSQAA